MLSMASALRARDFEDSQFTRIVNSCLKDFPNVKELRKEQRTCLINLARGKDVFAILPTGFGKSLIFQLFPRVVSALRSPDAPSFSTRPPLIARPALLSDPSLLTESLGQARSRLPVLQLQISAPPRSTQHEQKTIRFILAV